MMAKREALDASAPSRESKQAARDSDEDSDDDSDGGGGQKRKDTERRRQKALDGSSKSAAVRPSRQVWLGAVAKGTEHQCCSTPSMTMSDCQDSRLRASAMCKQVAQVPAAFECCMDQS